MNLLSLPKILSLPECIHDLPCVYFLLDKDKIVYIGKTVSIKSRMQKHNCSEKQFTDYRCLFFDNIDDATLYEKDYIKQYLPIYNKANNKLQTKKLLSLRASDEIIYYINQLAEKRQSTQANIIEEAVRDLAKKVKL